MENSCSSSSCTSCGIESASCPAPDRGEKNVVSRARPPRRGVGGGSSGGGSSSIPATQVVFANPNGGGGGPSISQNNQPAPPPPPPPPPPPQPKLVPQPAVIGTPSVSSDIAASKQPAPATTANGGKGLVPGSPEYCAQFPETELCRQGKAPPPPSPATPIYCGDPGAHPELCTERPVGAPAPKPSGAIGAHSQRLPFFAPSGAAMSLEQCIIDFVNMTPGRQITTIQASGPLATYATSSDAIVGIRNGRFGAADSFVNFMRSFRSGSPEVAAFCAAVTNTIAPAGKPGAYQSGTTSVFSVYGAPAGTAVFQAFHGGVVAPNGGAVSDGKVATIAFDPYRPVAIYARSPSGELRTAFGAANAAIYWSQMAPIDRRVAFYSGSGDEKETVQSTGFQNSAVPSLGEKEMYAASQEGTFISPTYAAKGFKGAGYVPQTGYHTPPFGSSPAWDARYSVPSPRLPAGQAQSGCISPPAGAVGQHSQRLPFYDRGIAPSGAIGAHSQRLPFFAPSGAAMDHDGYLDVFVQLPAEAQANVLTSLAFGQGEVRDPYAHFLAGLLRRGELMFNGEAVTDLAVSHIKNFANRAQAPSARGLIDLAIMQEGTAYGFVAPSNNGFAPAGNAAPQANQPPPGFTPEQWGALLAQNPEVAARLWTEFQQRPSTFSQVSGSIMQAANVVLSQLNASRAAALEERRADFAHQQAMARIQIDRENAAAARLAAQPQQPMMSISAPLEQPPAAPPVQQPPAAPPVQQPPADPASMSTGTMAAIGLGVVAVGGGGLYLATRSRGSRSARSNGFLDGLFGKSKGGKKPSKKAR